MIIGCDPGLSGALALYDGRELSLVDMPTRYDLVAHKMRRVIDEKPLIDGLRDWRMFGARILVIEKVSGMPGQSGPAAFTFGYGVGVVSAAALALGMTIERVAPVTWKAALGLSADKTNARKLASEVYAEKAGEFARVKDDGRAEAALIARWGWLTRGAL